MFRWIALIIAAVLAVAAFGAAAWRSGRATSVHDTAQVARETVESTVTAIGTLQPRRYVDVGAQVSGQIQRLHVAPGAQVAQGDLLVEIDPSVQRAAVDAGRAQLAGLRAQRAEQVAQARLARQQLDRQQQMQADGATRLEDLQVAQAEADAADARIEQIDAQIAQTRATLKADEARLGYTRIYAPISGTVVSVQAREGQTLNAAYQTPEILRIADLTTMTVWTDVSEADVRKVRAGTAVSFTTLGGQTEAKPRQWHGMVRQVLPAPPVTEQPAARAASMAAPAAKAVTYVVLFDVDNGDGELMPQMTAQATFVVARAADALVVPLSALTVEGDAHRVRVVDADGRVRPREVAIGVRGRHKAAIVDGLREGETVITAERAAATNRWIQW